MSTPIPRRRSSALERVAEPNVLVTYLCGYSLRTCASFMLWVDLILIITFFIMAILVSSVLHFYIITQHNRNETKYTFSLNSNQILTIDLHGSISAETSIEFAEIGKRVLQIVLSSACVHSFVTVTGLIAVYYDRLELMAPYLVLHITSVLWISSFIVLDFLFIGFRYVKLVWWILFPAILYFVAKLYKLAVIYSYHFHYSGFAKDQFKTPPHLTTQSPMQLPVTSVAESVTESLVFQKNVESDKLSLDENLSFNL